MPFYQYEPLKFVTLFPASPNIGAMTFGTMNWRSWPVDEARLAFLVFVEHFVLETVTTVFAAEANSFSHNSPPLVRETRPKGFQLPSPGSAARARR